MGGNPPWAMSQSSHCDPSPGKLSVGSQLDRCADAQEGFADGGATQDIVILVACHGAAAGPGFQYGAGNEFLEFLMSPEIHVLIPIMNLENRF
jgi:hypothetical protein